MVWRSLYPSELGGAMRRLAAVLRCAPLLACARNRGDNGAGGGLLLVLGSGTGAGEAFEEIAAKVFRVLLGSMFLGHGGLTRENQLRDVIKSHRVTAGNAFPSELSDELAEEEIHLVGGGKAVNVVKKLRGKNLGVHEGNSSFETVCVVGAERRASGSVRGTMIGVDQHVAALAAGVLVLAFGIGVLFWGHRLAFRRIDVTT